MISNFDSIKSLLASAAKIYGRRRAGPPCSALCHPHCAPPPPSKRTQWWTFIVRQDWRFSGRFHLQWRIALAFPHSHTNTHILLPIASITHSLLNSIFRPKHYRASVFGAVAAAADAAGKLWPGKLSEGSFLIYRLCRKLCPTQKHLKPSQPKLYSTPSPHPPIHLPQYLLASCCPHCAKRNGYANGAENATGAGAAGARIV